MLFICGMCMLFVFCLNYDLRRIMMFSCGMCFLLVIFSTLIISVSTMVAAAIEVPACSSLLHYTHCFFYLFSMPSPHGVLSQPLVPLLKVQPFAIRDIVPNDTTMWGKHRQSLIHYVHFESLTFPFNENFIKMAKSSILSCNING